ncbi:MAG: L-sorbosone dehydrogenase [Devosia sp.]|nr:L-sorbosone dehydrogenase [Devosia sp.]
MTQLTYACAASALALLATSAMAQDSAVLKGSAAFGDWKADKPGVTRLITPADLQAPNPQESTSNGPENATRPDGTLPIVPDGFKVDLVATGIENPRAMMFAPNGDLFISNSDQGEVLVFKATDGKLASEPTVFATGLNQPYGLAFYPSGDAPKYLYVAESNGLKRIPYAVGDTAATAEPETLFDNIDPEHHWTRDIVFSPDGKTLYYAVGSGSNFGELMDPTPAGGVDAWITGHPLGVAWGNEERRAAVLTYDPDGKNEKYFATGLRNCSGITLQPDTDKVWCVVNNVDELGDNVPFEYATSLTEGAFYGWPWYYIGDNPDPRWAETPRTDLVGKVTVPDVLFQAHSAPLGITFYEGDKFGADYTGDAFVGMHGSWNRNTRTGYKVVTLAFENGKPTGEYTDFMTGFVNDDASVWGRPVDVTEGPDGALYVSDDGSGSIWRVSKQ